MDKNKVAYLEYSTRDLSPFAFCSPFLSPDVVGISEGEGRGEGECQTPGSVP
jgi:hypothetical protein